MPEAGIEQYGCVPCFEEDKMVCVARRPIYWLPGCLEAAVAWVVAGVGGVPLRRFEAFEQRSPRSAGCMLVVQRRALQLEVQPGNRAIENNIETAG